jgi:hypothetical protein
MLRPQTSTLLYHETHQNVIFMVVSSWSISVTFLKRPVELLSSVLQCFPASPTPRRESGWFGADLGDAERENTIMDVLKVCLLQ